MWLGDLEVWGRCAWSLSCSPPAAFLEGSVLMEGGLQAAPSPCPPAGCLCVGTGHTEPTGLRSSWQSVYGREAAVKGPALPVRR